MRTIIVGDVHGCRAELESLLDRIAFASGDRLIFVGDLVARGPDSLGVLDVARRTGALIVRGNHEQKLLDWRHARLTATAVDATIGRMHRVIARALRPVDWTLIETTPLFVDLPEHGVRVVHAGVIPGVELDAQEPRTLLRIRTVRVPLTKKEARERGKRAKTENVLWGTRYVGPPHIVFGHNAAPGLQLHPWATGLDTGCVYGGRLTALVIPEGQRLPRTLAGRRALLVSEPAERVWFASAARAAAG